MQKFVLQSLRTLGLMPLVDVIRSKVQGWQNRSRNRTFRKLNPEVPIPPPAILYETYRLDFQKYHEGGLHVAKQILDFYHQHRNVAPRSILDWGCGPARVAKHLPQLLDGSVQIHGTDFNQETIAWCQSNIVGIQFYTNQLLPPTELPAHHYDLIYGISVLTHLSKHAQEHWLAELHRIASYEGIVILTTQGKAFRAKLSLSEQKSFDQGLSVVRSSGQEGRRTFSAFHPPQWSEQLFTDFSVLAHHPGHRIEGRIDQDIWVLQRVNK